MYVSMCVYIYINNKHKYKHHRVTGKRWQEEWSRESDGQFTMWSDSTPCLIRRSQSHVSVWERKRHKFDPITFHMSSGRRFPKSSKTWCMRWTTLKSSQILHLHHTTIADIHHNKVTAQIMSFCKESRIRTSVFRTSTDTEISVSP